MSSSLFLPRSRLLARYRLEHCFAPPFLRDRIRVEMTVSRVIFFPLSFVFSPIPNKLRRGLVGKPADDEWSGARNPSPTVPLCTSLIGCAEVNEIVSTQTVQRPSPFPSRLSLSIRIWSSHAGFPRASFSKLVMLGFLNSTTADPRPRAQCARRSFLRGPTPPVAKSISAVTSLDYFLFSFPLPLLCQDLPEGRPPYTPFLSV